MSYAYLSLISKTISLTNQFNIVISFMSLCILHYGNTHTIVRSNQNFSFNFNSSYMIVECITRNGVFDFDFNFHPPWKVLSK